MSGRNRSARTNYSQSNAGHARQAPAPGKTESTTEALAAAVEAELAKAEAQLAAFAHTTGESRPYEAFDFLALHSSAITAASSFEYDGHCPPITGQTPTWESKSVSTNFPDGSLNDSSTASDCHDAALANRVRVLEGPRNGAAASDVAADMEVAFRQLARMFSGDVAQQWQSAARQLDDARAMVEELRDILTAARHALSDLKRLHDEAPRVRASCNPACRKS